MGAELASAIINEVETAFGKEAVDRLPSGQLLREMDRGGKTGHAAAVTRKVMESNPSIAAQLPVTTVDVGLTKLHPVIYLSDYIRCLAQNGKLGNLAGDQGETAVAEFWSKLQPLRPNHPVFSLPVDQWGKILPFYLIADEGRGYKKHGIMVLGAEPVLGYGCDVAGPTDPGASGLKMNFHGNTFKTRLLYSVMPKDLYSSDAAPLHELCSLWAADIGKCYTHGIVVPGLGKIRAMVLGLKGDWPALDKLGQIKRHFRREAYPFGEGLCHLCLANTQACPSWHEHNPKTAPWVKTMHLPEAKLPWISNEPAFVTAIPMEPACGNRFFHIDLFHTVHKGVHAELAGSALAPGIPWHQL